MIRRDWSKDELDRMAGAYFAGLHQDDCSTPWDHQPDSQRAKHRRGVRALLDALVEVETEHLVRTQATQRNTIRVERDERKLAKPTRRRGAIPLLRRLMQVKQ